MIHIQSLIDDAKCFATVRELRWVEGIQCAACNSMDVGKRGFHSNHPACQRYACRTCGRQFDDLADTIFEGHHRRWT